ncbi:MAG: methylornithine synthase PylB [Candidatus Methanomethylophilaceae archaeon]
MSALDDVIRSAMDGEHLSADEIETVLSAGSERDREKVFECARFITERHFGRKVFTYGFVYFSTYCRNNCTFCYYRRDNGIERYRRSREEIVSLSEDLYDSGVNLIDLTMGEDPYFCGNGHREFLDTVKDVKDSTGAPIMASPGVFAREEFPRLKEAGADWFACYQETHNRGLFDSIRIGQDYDMRLRQKEWANGCGLLAEEGIMTGIGESVRDRAESVVTMTDSRIQQVRVMTYVPQDGAPLTPSYRNSQYDELLTIAALRMANPGKLIPASMDIEGMDGLESRIMAGANVVTSIVPPNVRLAGVAQHDLDIDNGNRSVEAVNIALDRMGYGCADGRDYRNVLRTLRGD